MIPLAIHGIGAVGAFGAGRHHLRAALQGEKRVEPEITEIKTKRGSHQLPVFRAATDDLKTRIPNRNRRRLDHFSQLALLGACLACEDSGSPLNGARTGLIIASAYGATATTFSFLDSLIDDGDLLASPTLFANSVHNAAAAHIAAHLQITGPSLSLTQGQLSLPMALLTAAQWLADGRADTILCGVVEEYCDVLGYCWQNYLEQKETTTAENSDPAPAFYGPGEGSLFLRLSRPAGTAPLYGYLEKLELNPNPIKSSAKTSTGPRFYSRPPGRKHPEINLAAPSQQLQIDLSQICGVLPIAAAFDLAALIIMLNEQTLYIHEPPQPLRILPFTESSLSYRQDWPPSQKPLTGNCYWITNRLNLDKREGETQ
ncbi:MAG: beta-ketoacyl synthase chain length factor [Deltaproteobacteria bacterium]|nr:beta-ketoacyl synthase chain length factor [Deltaproteobacteria bacterium]